MIDSFIIDAILGGFLIALICGVMGCFVVWRRMAYFGDSLAHSALLGIALGLASGLGLGLSIFIISMIFALLLLWLEHRGVLATDTLLGILAHGALSLAVVWMALLGIPISLHALLFGDILTVDASDLRLLGLGAVLVVGVVVMFWNKLVLITASHDLAKAEGVQTFVFHIVFLVLMTITVAASVRMVGVLLITSMLIIPAATARHLARSPEAMAIVSVLVGCLAVGAGIAMSLITDAPTGPAIVSCLALFFALVTIVMAIADVLKN